MMEEPAVELRQCLDLLEDIEASYPKGVFDREMLHGEMDFRYRRIHEMRQKLESFSPLVRRFAGFVHALRDERKLLGHLLKLLLEQPRFFAASALQGHAGLLQCVNGLAKTISGRPAEIMKVLGRMRLAGIVDKEYAMCEDFRSLASAYLMEEGPLNGSA